MDFQEFRLNDLVNNKITRAFGIRQQRNQFLSNSYHACWLRDLATTEMCPSLTVLIILTFNQINFHEIIQDSNIFHYNIQNFTYMKNACITNQQDKKRKRLSTKEADAVLKLRVFNLSNNIMQQESPMGILTGRSDPPYP